MTFTVIVISQAHSQKNCKRGLSIRHFSKAAWNSASPLDGFSSNFVSGIFTKICLQIPIFVKNLTKITGTVHEDVRIFMIYRHDWPSELI